MKKKFVKLLTVIAAFTFLFPVFALVGCTDKKDKPRVLDGVELRVVGTWKNNLPAGGITYTFKDDGTYTISNGNSGEFRHDGEGIETDGEARGHYYIIKAGGGKNALFDIEPNKLIPINGSDIYSTDSIQTLIRQ